MKKILLSILMIGGIGVAATAQLNLHDQTTNHGTNGVISNYYIDVATADTVIQCADDFVVPSGGSWDVSAITVAGFRGAGGPGLGMDSVQVQIYSDGGGMPGTIIYDASHTLSPAMPITGDTTITITIPAQNLVSGTYWLSVYGYCEYGASNSERWNWMQNLSAQGSNGMLIDVDDWFGLGVTTWTDVNTLGLGANDFVFGLGGTGSTATIAEDEMVEVNVYPNPTVDFVTVSAGEDYVKQVSVFNANGQRINTSVAPIGGKIDMTELPAGMYILEVTTTSGMAHVEVIKE